MTSLLHLLGAANLATVGGNSVNVISLAHHTVNGKVQTTITEYRGLHQNRYTFEDQEVELNSLGDVIAVDIHGRQHLIRLIVHREVRLTDLIPENDPRNPEYKHGRQTQG